MERAGLRASDADRRRVVDVLQQHYVDGRLSTDELDDRTHRAMAARTFGELDALTADLPATPPAPAAEPTPAEERSGRPWDDGSFRTHALSYGLVMVLLVAIWLLTTPGGYFWPVWPMLGWGIGVAFHALACSVGRPRARDGRRRAADRDED